MSDVSDFLAHFGIKGMHWGVRRNNIGTPSEVTVSHTPGRKVTAKGGEFQPAHEDAKRAAAARQTAKASTTDALSNDELKKLVERMNLEQQYSNLTTKKKSTVSEGHKKVKEILDMSATANRAMNDPFVKTLITQVTQAKVRK